MICQLATKYLLVVARFFNVDHYTVICKNTDPILRFIHNLCLDTINYAFSDLTDWSYNDIIEFLVNWTIQFC